MNQEEYSIILQECTTGQDDYVNASLLCKKFGKTWTNFKNSTGARAYLKALGRKGLTVARTIQAGRNKHTFVHPLVAIKLAEWLNTDFEVFVKEVFKSYLTGDADLGVEFIERDTDPDRVKRAKRRLEVVEINKQVHELVKMNESTQYWKVHQDRYRGLYRKTSKELREECGAKPKETPLNFMSQLDLTMNSLVQEMALESKDTTAIRDIANDMRIMYERRMGRKLTPKWEDNCLSPKKAREELTDK